MITFNRTELVGSPSMCWDHGYVPDNRVKDGYFNRYNGNRFTGDIHVLLCERKYRNPQSAHLEIIGLKSPNTCFVFLTF